MWKLSRSHVPHCLIGEISINPSIDLWWLWTSFYLLLTTTYHLLTTCSITTIIINKLTQDQRRRAKLYISTKIVCHWISRLFAISCSRISSLCINDASLSLYHTNQKYKMLNKVNRKYMLWHTIELYFISQPGFFCYVLPTKKDETP